MIEISEYMKLSLEDRQLHIRLTEACIFRNIKHHQECRGILAHVLNTTLPDRNIGRVCHSCGNGKCCNPNHMYWGTSSENSFDMYKADPNLGKRIGNALKAQGHFKKLAMLPKRRSGKGGKITKLQAQERLIDIKLQSVSNLRINELSLKWEISKGAVKRYIKNHL